MKQKLFVPVALYALFGILFMCCTVFLGLYVGNLSFPLIDPDTQAQADVSAHVSVNDTAQKPTVMLMLDPGHGGEDGGASSADGAVEKELNLCLSETVADLSMLFGIPCSTTRSDDRLLYDHYNELSDYTGKKKSLDLKNRLRMTEESGARLLVSLHMNKFSDPRYKGLQIYYSTSDEDSGDLARVIQSYVKDHLQGDNARQAKPAGSSIYLLNKAEIPAIMIECGFLSNPEEARQLSTKEYRDSLACTVFTPIAEYLTRQE